MTTQNQLITLGDILKSEADSQSRIAITAPKGTKIGQLVKYEVRKRYLVALSDEKDGKVLVQPHNCVINLDFVTEADITDKQTGDQGNTPLTTELFKSEGDTYGIKYIGTPKNA